VFPISATVLKLLRKYSRLGFIGLNIAGILVIASLCSLIVSPSLGSRLDVRLIMVISLLASLYTLPFAFLWNRLAFPKQ
jgi:hypothetical protein